jgi:hypothetical protein
MTFSRAASTASSVTLAIRNNANRLLYRFDPNGSAGTRRLVFELYFQNRVSGIGQTTTRLQAALR